MSCHVCGQEAVGRCHNCGALYCDRHGDGTCVQCSTSIVAGDPRDDRISTSPRSATQRAGWWRPQPAEPYSPPACYQCGGIAKRICPNCQVRYCPDHAGANGMCAQCSQSSYLGIGVLIAVAVILGALMLIGWWQRGG